MLKLFTGFVSGYVRREVGEKVPLRLVEGFVEAPS